MTEEQVHARMILYAKAGKRSLKLRDIEIEDVRFLKFKTIIAIKDALARNNESTETDILKAVFANYDKEYNPQPNEEKEVVEFIFYIIDGIKAIAVMEERSFETEADSVDTSGLEKFKEVNIIDNLANGDILKWKEIQELPYFDIFIKMLRIQELNKIEKARMQQSKV